MCVRSTSISLMLRPDAAEDVSGTGIVNRGPAAVIMARSTTLRSSRIFPGQAYRCSPSMLLFAIVSMRLPNAFENSSTKCHTSSGMSSTRSRSGGHTNRKHVEPVVQVLAERAGDHRLFEVPVRRGDDARIDGDDLRAAEPLESPLLENAQQLDLHFRRQIADLIEEDRRVIGDLESSNLARQRPGERAFLAAEQLALDECGGNGRTVDPHHRASVPRASLVNLRRAQLFAGAGLTQQQHGRVRAGDLFDLLHDEARGRALTDNDALVRPLHHIAPRGPVLASQLFTQPTHFEPCFIHAELCVFLLGNVEAGPDVAGECSVA